MKFINYQTQKSNFLIKLFLSIVLVLKIIKCDIKKESKNQRSECSISSIHMPIGSSSPVMVYNAKNQDQTWRITVLDREQFNELNVEGDLFYTDKTTEESWFISESIDDKGFESLKDAFSLCKVLNAENKKNKDQLANNKDYEELRTDKLPNFIAKRSNLNRISENEENRKLNNSSKNVISKNNSTNHENKEKNEKEAPTMKSFLQLQSYNMLTNTELSEIEAKIDNLGSDNFEIKNDSINEADEVNKQIDGEMKRNSKEEEYKKMMFIN